jgi:hypothetical protein
MGIGLSCFALAVPVFALPRVRQKMIFAALVLAFISPAIGLLPNMTKRMGPGWFCPTPKRIALGHVAAAIEELRRQGPIDLVARWPAEYWEVDYCLPGCRNFNRPSGAEASGMRRVALINHHWGASMHAGRARDEDLDLEQTLNGKITKVLFSEGYYELVEVAPQGTEEAKSESGSIRR